MTDENAPIALRPVSLTSPEAQALVRELDAELTARYPDEGASFFRLDEAEVSRGRGAFVVAFEGDAAVACGAVRLLGGGDAEIKRMYVTRSHRGRGLARRVLEALESTARELGAQRLVLETGARQPEAIALYRSVGFAPIAPFGDYDESPFSLFFGKPVS